MGVLVVGVVETVGGAPAPTVTVPFISVGCTVQINVYVPAAANVHSPCQEGAPDASPAAAGMPLQLGVAGPPVKRSPCLLAAYGLPNLTEPPGAIVAVAGCQ